MEQLLTTKLYIPPTRPELVPRPRLIEQLNDGLHRKVTLISAPAGFGKTTLVADWLDKLRADSKKEDQTENRIAWLSLDGDDNDPVRFLTYLITALNHVEGAKSAIGERALGILQSPQPQPVEFVLTTLINEIATIPDRIILVLDDYHLIEAETIHESLSFLIENIPAHTGPDGQCQGMHLVIATREDPYIPLSRLRASGHLTEIRAVDLRFTPSEVAEFLNQMMGLDLSAESITALETRTEGWIAGLQMAALSLQGRADSADFIQAFTGSHRFVLDYLVEEVLQRQPAHVRGFLLKTSILDRLSSPLCNAVTGSENGKEMLETLERGNLFVIPLDDQRQWYRYHHLFADVLKARLMEEQPNQVDALHRRASEWYEQNNLQSEAIHHALATKDFERVAELSELTWQAMDDSFQTATWIGWVKKLPDEMIRIRPVLSTQYAWALWMDGELEASEARLQEAERWLDPDINESEQPEETAEEMVVVDEEQFRTLPTRIALVRIYNAQAQGDVSSAVKHAELALKLTPEEDQFGRAQATVSLGFTYWARGDLEAAHKALVDWIESMLKEGNVVFSIASTFALADIMIAQGRLQDAVRAYKGSLQLASKHAEHVQRVIAHLYLGLSMLYHEMGDREAAAQNLQISKELGELSTLPDWPYRWCLAQAHLKESRGELEAALDLLDEAKGLYVRNTLPDIRPLEALKARVYVRQDRLPKALAWVNERGLSVDDELSYLREFEHISLARVFITEYKHDRADRSNLEAIGLLERLLSEAEDKNRMGSVLEILLVLALAHQVRGDDSKALASLERALVLAEPEGYLRIFVDEGLPMARLLDEALSRGISPDYVRRLLSAFPIPAPVEADSFQNQPSKSELVEPLSEREIEVLQLIAEGLTNPEIATRLYISLNTVKAHTRNINGKLEVNNRMQAAVRARALGILPSN